MRGKGSRLVSREKRGAARRTQGKSLNAAGLFMNLGVSGRDSVKMAAMTGTLTRALIALVPASLLLIRAVRIFIRGKTLGSLLQLLATGFLIAVIFTHLCEGLHWFAQMRWGEPHSIGHYVDLASAILAVALFAAGYLLQVLVKRHA